MIARLKKKVISIALSQERSNVKEFFLAIFRKEIAPILTFSTSERVSEGGGSGHIFILEVPDYESAMLIYLSYVLKSSIFLCII